MKTIVTAGLLALAILTALILTGSGSAAQPPVTIGVDVDPSGNTATSLGRIDSCVSVKTGDTFEVDLFVTDVVELLAWETYFVYDMQVINVVSRDVMMFQAANPESQVFDVSEGLPDIDGQYGVAAADIALPPAPDSGSGVLARLTLKAVGAGVSPASLRLIDWNEDGTIDLGPTLKAAEGTSIGDADQDGFFDGPITNAQIAVDTPCAALTPIPSPTGLAPVSPSPTRPPTSPTPSPSPTVEVTPELTAGPPAEGEETPSDNGPPWVIVYVGGAVAAVLLGGVALLVIRRRRAG